MSFSKDELQLSQLLDLAIRGLGPMYDVEKGLFCHRLTRTPSGLVREGVSHRYTLIALLGLLRAESAGLTSPVDTGRAIDSLLDTPAWITNLGDLGLLLWVCALSGEERLAHLSTVVDLESALARYRAARERGTMELAWFLSGVAHVSEASRARTAALAGVANRTCDFLQSNQGDSGIFGHAGLWKSLAGTLRGRIGSFADQAYPIYALATFARVFKRKAAFVSALRCANAICRQQGPLGQWWWHYDSVTGRVIDRYPVYSVHQDGMAPMALLALQDASQVDYRQHIYRGLEWISGANELEANLLDREKHVIWRSIYQPGMAKHFSRLRTLAGAGHPAVPLRILHECRPYHLGWLLYAFAPEGTKMRGRIAA